MVGFVGREAEVNAVIETLRKPDARLLTLFGHGCVGKTELALRVADYLVSEFEHGGAFVSLEYVTSADQVLYEVGKVLNLQQRGAASQSPGRVDATSGFDDLVIRYFRGKHFLLVLDNLEQIKDSERLVDVLMRLLEGTAKTNRLKILTTSRWDNLNIWDGHSHEVPLLAIPDDLENPPPFEELQQYDAVRIFIAAAERAQPEFGKNLTMEQAILILKLCAQLDRVPIGLAYAARYLGKYDLETMVENSRNLDSQGASRLPERQQSLEASASWSYKLLDRDMRRLLRCLSVFRGGWTLAAAQHICSEGTESVFNAVEQQMAKLADKLLIRKEGMKNGNARFAMQPTVREFAMKMLKDYGEEEEIMSAHANYYLALAVAAEKAVTDSRQIEWLAKVEQEEDNLRVALTRFAQSGEVESALELAGRLWRFWLVRARFGRGAEWIEEALALSATGAPSSARALALLGAGVLEIEQHNLDRAAARLAESEAAYRLLNDQTGLAYTLTFQASVAQHRGDKELCLKLLADSERLFRRVSDTWGLALALCYSATAQAGTDKQFRTGVPDGNPVIAQSLYMQSNVLFSQLGDKWGMALATMGLANIAYRGKDRATARGLYSGAVSMLRDIRAIGIACWSLTSLGNIELVAGNFQEAQTYHAEALPIHKTLGNTYSIAYSANGLGEVARSEGRYADALPYYREALDAREQAMRIQQEDPELDEGFLEGHAWTLCNTAISSYFAEQETADQAEGYFRKSLSFFHQLGYEPGNFPGMLLCLVGLAAVANDRADHDQAAMLLSVADRYLEPRRGEAPLVELQPVDNADYEKLRKGILGKRGNKKEWDKGWSRGRRLALEQAVEFVLHGGTLKAVDRPAGLTEAEENVVRLVVQGNADKAIAEKLHLSIFTVRTHKRNASRKMGVHGTAMLSAAARELGIE
jgi:predicted ATPase/DNA-binding CsgD family transcriptional regulator